MKGTSSKGRPPSQRRKVREGEVVAIPATDGNGYLLGVVARVEKNRSLGAAILLYIFAPRWIDIPVLGDAGELLPANALSVVLTGVRRIIEGVWPIVGTLDYFEKSEWPIPVFGRISLSTPVKAWLVCFSEDRIGAGAPREEWEVSVEEARKYPTEAVWGVDVAAFEATKRLRELQ